MIDRSISSSSQRLRNLLRAPAVKPDEITETILEESGIDEATPPAPSPPETPKDKPMTDINHATDAVTSLLAELDQRASKIVERTVTLGARGRAAYDKQDQLLDAKEKQLAALEDALNRHTNGGPG